LIIPPSLIFGFIPKPFSSNASKVFKTDSSNQKIDLQLRIQDLEE